MPVKASLKGSICILRFENGAVNTLSVGPQGVVRDIRDALQRAEAESDCTAIVIAGAGRMFCGGADITNFDEDGERIDELRALMGQVENCKKPVIAAIHGVALGGGLELAMAAHLRVVSAKAKFGLPEVTLGLIPGAGGTQRLPRLVGAAAALDMMLGGKSIDSSRAEQIGLVDWVTAGDVVSVAVAIAAAGPPQLRRTGSLAVPADRDAAVASKRVALKSGRSLAPQHIIDCVEAMSEDLAEGLDLEARRFTKLMGSDAARGLRHAFFGERTVARVPGLSQVTTVREMRHVGVVGGGTMGTGIAIALLNVGLAVTLIEARQEARDGAVSTIQRFMRREADRGRISGEVADQRCQNLVAGDNLSLLERCDLVIEAVFEDMQTKRQIFAALDAIVRPDAILASNTSTLDIDRIADAVVDPSRVIGLHFFSPANIMRLLEIVRGRRTAPDVLATALALGKRLGKVSVVAGVCDGFIGNRIFEEYLRQVWFLIEEGASPAQIDGALERWGMAMGPCRTMDLVGQDIGWAIRKRRAVEQPDRPYSIVIDRICELGRFGQKTGKGIYCYGDSSEPETDPEVEALIADHRATLGLELRAIADEEIVERCLLAMVNEGARIVGEGIAYRPVDVDMTYLHGYGFARDRGGPMFQADILGGPAFILDRLRALQGKRHGWAWAAAPLIERLAAEGALFSELNR